jgi:outer membrane lipoprotein-sorting protein
MKKMATGILGVLVLVAFVQGQELTGKQIIEKMNDLLNPETTYGKSRMTITTTSGKKRTFVMESWSKGAGEKTLVRYLEPVRVKGLATLMLNNADDIWMFFPRTQRVRKLASHAKKQKMQGSDFSYEDMGGGDAFMTDYNAKRLADEKMENGDCFLVELIRKTDSDMTYSRLILWVVKENFVPIVIDYYDEKNPDRHLKRLVQSDIKVIDGLPVAFMSVMTNKNDNSETRMELLEAKFNIELDDRMFTERGLKK